MARASARAQPQGKPRLPRRIDRCRQAGLVGWRLERGVILSVERSVNRDNGLNADIGRAGIYDKLVHKRITALAELRNNADHGHFEKVSKDDAEDLVRYVRRFCADHLVHPRP
jgi:hypothetical protein